MYGRGGGSSSFGDRGGGGGGRGGFGRGGGGGFRGGSRGGGEGGRGGFRGGRGGGRGRGGGFGDRDRDSSSSLGFRSSGGVRGGKRGGGGDFSPRGGGRGGFRGGRGGRGGRGESRGRGFRFQEDYGDTHDREQHQQYQERKHYYDRDNNNNNNGDDYAHQDNYYGNDEQEDHEKRLGDDAAPTSTTEQQEASSKILEIGQGGTEVHLHGTSSLRYAIVCSIITNKPITFSLVGKRNNNSEQQQPPIPTEAISFLRLISQITTGSQFALSSDGDSLRFTPGLITATGSIVHEYNPPASATSSNNDFRGLGYFVEPLLLILPFSRRATSVTLVGPSHSEHDLCPHTLRTVTTRIAQAFGIECSLRIVRHSGKNPGCVILSVSPCRKLKPVKLLDLGFVSRVRGIAFGTDVSPDLPQRAAVAAKGSLLNFLPDVFVVTDISQSPKAPRNKNVATSEDGDSTSNINKRLTSAFGVMLVAETTTKRGVISQEATAAPREDPDAVGQRAAALLLDEIASGCCVDRHHQSLTLMLMALAPDDVSSVRFGEVSSAALSTLELMEKFLSVRPVIKDSQVENAPEGSTIISCFGSATINLTKRSG